MTLASIYLPDLLASAGGAAVLALVFMIFLPKFMGKDAPPLSKTPGYFYVLAPLLAAITSSALYLINNESPLTIVIWSLIAGLGAVATLTDFNDHRVPNVLSYNHFILVIIALVVNAFLTGDFWGLMWAGVALLGTAILFFGGVFLLKIGVGDFKYIPVIAAALAFINPWLALAWLITSYVANVLFAIITFMFWNVEKNGERSKAKAPMIPPFYFSLWILVGVVSLGMVNPLVAG